MAPLKILIIDDEPMVARSLARLLKGDHEVEVRTTFETARDALGSADFDLVLTDFDLDVGTAMDLPLDGRRFVVGTGREAVPAAFAAKAAAVLLKPYSIREIRTTIAEACR